jgi:predicted secreted acid phosphatase
VPSRSQWLADVDAAMAGSWTYLDQQVAAEGDRRLAINLDIDNTSLASHYAPGAPVPYVRHFAWHARNHHVALLFNTGRVTGGGRLKRATAQLQAAGYPVTEICGRASSSETLAHSKQRCRRHFVAEGYTLVANVGNRATDFVGGNYEKAFRLPDYDKQLA